jgi:hypothetical protein
MGPGIFSRSVSGLCRSRLRPSFAMLGATIRPDVVTTGTGKDSAMIYC